ncbi:MAG TPA: (d)CMP kinase [Candidatus Acidoferrales bacterium]|nr:(d)CMP kinase [Candidatus Acidoferrales bacterium]
MPVQVAIDGPVASGKSTVAKQLAQRLGFAFLDTGALYRAVAYMALARRIAPNDEHAVASLATLAVPEVVPDEGDPRTYRIRLEDRLLGPELFTPEVSQAVSPIAAMPVVRTRLIEAQRAFAVGRDVVMAGRDIGTVVLPQARFKFFLTASVDARVDRRLRELHQAGVSISREELRDEIVARDLRDTTRAVSPLAKAADAVVVETSDMPVEDVVDTLERAVTAKQS